MKQCTINQIHDSMLFILNVQSCLQLMISDSLIKFHLFGHKTCYGFAYNGSISFRLVVTVRTETRPGHVA